MSLSNVTSTYNYKYNNSNNVPDKPVKRCLTSDFDDVRDQRPTKNRKTDDSITKRIAELNKAIEAQETLGDELWNENKNLLKDLTKSLNQDNYKDLWKKAIKYEVPELIKGSEQIFLNKQIAQKIENLEIAAEVRDSQLVSNCLSDLFSGKFNLSIDQKMELLGLAEKYNLPDLPLLIVCENAKILPNQSILVSYRDHEKISFSEQEALKKSLMEKNLWHTPKIELSYTQIWFGKEFSEDFQTILEQINQPTSLQIEKNVTTNFDGLVNKYPAIKHLRIIHNCVDCEIENLFESIKKNTSLESLQIVLTAFETNHDLWSQTQFKMKEALYYNNQMRSDFSIGKLKFECVETATLIKEDSLRTDEILLRSIDISDEPRQECTKVSGYVYRYTGEDLENPDKIFYVNSKSSENSVTFDSSENSAISDEFETFEDSERTETFGYSESSGLENSENSDSSILEDYPGMDFFIT